jgi:hypothetical protein
MISYDSGAGASLAEYRAHLRTQQARDAFDVLVNAAEGDPRFLFDPGPHGAIKRTVNYQAGQRVPYSLIVNANDLLFYFRRPSGRASSEMQSMLQAAGLEASFNKQRELRARVRNVSDANTVLSHLLFDAQGTADHQRLSAGTLAKATPEFIYAAVQKFLTGEVSHSFGPSTDYDLIADDGSRLPPKAVFGLALSNALAGAPIGPKDFTAGETSPCFRLLRNAGYQIVPKAAQPDAPTGDADADEDGEWSEGKRRLVSHLQRERRKGLANAKKAQYRRKYGKLTCEQCGLDPVAAYRTSDAEACIEVHHSTTQVSDMQEGHKTTLDDLRCLCANCHRLVHRLLRAYGTSLKEGSA